MNISQLVTEAKTKKGCLSHLKTLTGRRKRGPSHNGEVLKLNCEFLSDEAKIACSKSFRLMSHKTQVVTAPNNPHIRNRHTHVHEVMSVGVILSDVLGTNTNLVRAIALGHDIGHVPLGHAGEKYLKEVMELPNFCHEKMGPIITQKIERCGRGLNLTFETLDGMMRHSGNLASPTMTPEAWVIRYADKMGYLFADYNDIVNRMQFPMNFPVGRELQNLVDEFGFDQRERTTTAMCGLIIESAECGKVSFEDSEVAKKFNRIRTLMYELYRRVAIQDVRPILDPVLNYLQNLNICDPYLLLALMTDDDVLMLSGKRMLDFSYLQRTALADLLPVIDQISPFQTAFDLCDPGLDW